MEINDTYQTIASPSEEMLFKEKGSKFFGYAFPIDHEDEVKPIIEDLKKTTSACCTLLLCLSTGCWKQNFISC
ncbi:hypothetical protein AAGS39_36780 [Flavobacterium sp. CGRL2]